MRTASKLVYSKENYYTENGEEYKIKTTVSLGDDCHNNICEWSITADIRWKNEYGIYKEYMCGCCHDEIIRHCPELAKFIPMHVCNHYGAPMYPAAEELISSCGLTEDECRKLQEESESFNDEMIKFIDNMFGRENMISEGSTISENDTICINIKYHKIGEVFNYKVGMSEMTLRVDKCDRCSGCAFENYIYDCVKSGCLGCEREDGESVRYTIVNT